MRAGMESRVQKRCQLAFATLALSVAIVGCRSPHPGHNVLYSDPTSICVDDCYQVGNLAVAPGTGCDYPSANWGAEWNYEITHASSGVFEHQNEIVPDGGQLVFDESLTTRDSRTGGFPPAWRPWLPSERTEGCRSETRGTFDSVVPGNCAEPFVLKPGYSLDESHSLRPSRADSGDGGTTFGTDSNGATFDDAPSPILMTPSTSNDQPTGLQPRTPSTGRAGIPLPQPSFQPAYTPPQGSSTGSQSGTASPGIEPTPSRPVPGLPAPSIHRLEQPQRRPSGTRRTKQRGATSSDVIELPPRRPTSVRIDLQPGSPETTLSLPHPTRTPVPQDQSSPMAPSVPTPHHDDTPSAPGERQRPVPPAPQPSLRPMPPVPGHSPLPGSAAYYHVPGRRYGQQTGPEQDDIPQLNRSTGLQPTGHWQPVPEQVGPANNQWRDMQQYPHLFAVPAERLTVPATQYNRSAAQTNVGVHRASDRVIYLPPPPRR